jgi:hypothetical protein
MPKSMEYSANTPRNLTCGWLPDVNVGSLSVPTVMSSTVWQSIGWLEFWSHSIFAV